MKGVRIPPFSDFLLNLALIAIETFLRSATIGSERDERINLLGEARPLVLQAVSSVLTGCPSSRINWIMSSLAAYPILVSARPRAVVADQVRYFYSGGRSRR